MDFMQDLKKTSSLLMNNNLKFQELDLNLIKYDLNQPRKNFNEDEIKQLADSIKEYGVLQPITVRQCDNENGKYLICFGERRYRASIQAGKNTIPVIIIDSNKDLLEKQLVENIQRSNLTHDEIAESIKFLINDGKMKKKDLANKLGKSNAYVSNYYSFSKMPSDIRSILQKLTNDMTLIIEIKKILNSVNDEEIKQDIINYLELQNSINRDTPKKIKEMFIDDEDPNNNDDTNNDNNSSQIIEEYNENTDIENQYNNKDYFNDYSNIETNHNNNNYDEFDEFDDDDYCNDYEMKEKPKKTRKTDKNIDNNEVNTNELLCYIVEDEMSVFDAKYQTLILSLSDEFFEKLKNNNKLSSFNKIISELLK